MDVLRELFWFYARYVTVMLVIGLVIIFAGCVVYGAVPWQSACLTPAVPAGKS
jgi:hypothetical protein